MISQINNAFRLVKSFGKCFYPINGNLHHPGIPWFVSVHYGNLIITMEAFGNVFGFITSINRKMNLFFLVVHLLKALKTGGL